MAAFPVRREPSFATTTDDRAAGLYDPNATVVPRAGETVVGHDGIRRMVAGFIGMKARLQSRVVNVVTAGDVALL